MIRLQPTDIIKLQKTLNRGTIVKIHDLKTDKVTEATYDGFVDYACPYRYCELHPKNPGQKLEKACDGFMKWIIKNETHEGCPYLGGYQFTASDQKVITDIKIKTKNITTEEFNETWVEPGKYVK